MSLSPVGVEARGGALRPGDRVALSGDAGAVRASFARATAPPPAADASPDGKSPGKGAGPSRFRGAFSHIGG